MTLKQKFVGVALGVLVAAPTLYLLWPMGCGPTDGGPLEGTARDLCPLNPARIGITWATGTTGLVVACAVAFLLGFAVAAYSWRRLSRVPKA